jgi:CRP-like cAMP-binding protein
MATASMALDALRASPLFAELPEDHLQRLAAGAKPMTLQPGDFLIIEGEQADDLYVVVSGELEVTKRSGNAEIPLARVGPGAIQGELAALERGQRMASVRALTETEVLRIPFEAVLDLLSAGPDAALGIIAPSSHGCAAWRRLFASARSWRRWGHCPLAWRMS